MYKLNKSEAEGAAERKSSAVQAKPVPRAGAAQGFQAQQLMLKPSEQKGYEGQSSELSPELLAEMEEISEELGVSPEECEETVKKVGPAQIGQVKSQVEKEPLNDVGVKSDGVVQTKRGIGNGWWCWQRVCVSVWASVGGILRRGAGGT